MEESERETILQSVEDGARPTGLQVRADAA